MAWEKLGLVFDLRTRPLTWLKSHAMLPTPLLLDDRIRVYFTGRDAQGCSRISFVDVDRGDPRHILYLHDRPLLDLGKLGTFDDSGTLCTCAVRDKKNGRVYLYYNGYNRRVTVPWSNAIGIAESFDEGVTFRRKFEGPVIDRNALEPYFTVSPSIVRENGIWHMWYTSGTGWVVVNGVPEPLYVIKYGQSRDGVQWQRDGRTCIVPLSEQEANARPAVIHENGLYRMWFCYRGSLDFRDGGDSYRIGYAEAVDPVHWVRDETWDAIALCPEEWDSKMQAYPSVIQTDGSTYLFYNGNGFVVHGFGCAVMQ